MNIYKLKSNPFFMDKLEAISPIDGRTRAF